MPDGLKKNDTLSIFVTSRLLFSVSIPNSGMQGDGGQNTFDAIRYIKSSTLRNIGNIHTIHQVKHYLGNARRMQHWEWNVLFLFVGKMRRVKRWKAYVVFFVERKRQKEGSARSLGGFARSQQEAGWVSLVVHIVIMEKTSTWLL